MFCFAGGKPDFSQRSMQFLKDVSFPLQPGHLQVQTTSIQPHSNLIACNTFYVHGDMNT